MKEQLGSGKRRTRPVNRQFQLYRIPNYHTVIIIKFMIIIKLSYHICIYAFIQKIYRFRTLQNGLKSKGEIFIYLFMAGGNSDVALTTQS